MQMLADLPVRDHALLEQLDQKRPRNVEHIGRFSVAGKEGAVFSVAFSGLYAAMSPPVASSLAAAGSAISTAASRSHSGARGRRSCGLRFGTSHSGSSGCCQRSIVPSSWTIVRNGTPASYNKHIADFDERHTAHCAPARNSASRTARWDRLHCPRRDFSSIVIDCPRYHTSTSGTPGLTPRFLRIAPLVTDAATGS